MTLSDGCPVWEGAAVLFGSPGERLGGRWYVSNASADNVNVFLSGSSWTVPASPGALVLDLSHRPTRLELAARIAALSERVTVYFMPAGLTVDEDGRMTFTKDTDDGETLRDIWRRWSTKKGSP